MNPKLKRMVKSWLLKQRLRYIKWRYAFDGTDLAEFIQQLGVGKGDTLLLHCSLDGFAGFSGKPRDIINILQDAVGESGTLLMPTLPFAGSAIQWADSETIFDVRRTPSATGLVTELFRRLPGVVRSVHPTHSVAAWGAKAQLLCAEHHLCKTPCGVGSPYGRLLDEDGTILLLGVDIRAMTFFHCAEEILEEKYPFSPFTEKLYTLASYDQAKNLLTTKTRLFDPIFSRRRDTRLMIPELKKNRGWHHEKLKLLDGYHFKARTVLACLDSMAQRGEFCYHPPRDNKQ